jgi:hypothetical protein
MRPDECSEAKSTSQISNINHLVLLLCDEVCSTEEYIRVGAGVVYRALRAIEYLYGVNLTCN